MRNVATKSVTDSCRKGEPETPNHVLLMTILNPAYPITVDVRERRVEWFVEEASKQSKVEAMVVLRDGFLRQLLGECNFYPQSREIEKEHHVETKMVVINGK
ncbi:hypothetical protein Pmani_000122 [Petrolisthes manimaculis]|uniref:Uncharacterized protein n=1 Tax=Petrolisthes manimaculis TaxID=1843537 RepID=A0AAE1QMB8_9EUCA|nr:hypothetical protein Pmani_000122 [Petrolisthes manimaculis]